MTLCRNVIYDRLSDVLICELNEPILAEHLSARAALALEQGVRAHINTANSESSAHFRIHESQHKVRMRHDHFILAAYTDCDFSSVSQVSDLTRSAACQWIVKRQTMAYPSAPTDNHSESEAHIIARAKLATPMQSACCTNAMRRRSAGTLRRAWVIRRSPKMCAAMSSSRCWKGCIATRIAAGPSPPGSTVLPTHERWTCCVRRGGGIGSAGRKHASGARTAR